MPDRLKEKVQMLILRMGFFVKIALKKRAERSVDETNAIALSIVF
jgi:hypothetical protein